MRPTKLRLSIITTLILGCVLGVSSTSTAAILPAPGDVPGKELSDFLDRNTAPVLDAGQVISWDGAGGATDGVDYSGIFPAGTSLEVDAIAHRRDLYFQALRADSSHLLFSAGNGTSPVTTGSLVTTEGETIGYAGDINYETAGSTGKGIWAAGPSIDATTLPFDVDGLEVWGPDPPGSDADRFSVLSDAALGVSVWTAAGAPYIAHSEIVGAVTSLLGPVPTNIGDFRIDLDALMSRGDDDDWAPGDSIIFSIRQISDPTDLADGFYATGSEIFVLDNTPAGPVASYLSHGGHSWDHAYSLAAMKEVTSGRQLDINAIESIAVPEPSAFLFLCFLLSSIGFKKCLGHVR